MHVFREIKSKEKGRLTIRYLLLETDFKYSVINYFLVYNTLNKVTTDRYIFLLRFEFLLTLCRKKTLLQLTLYQLRKIKICSNFFTRAI